MGKGTKDVALVFNGGLPFSEEREDSRIKRDQYDARLKQTGGSRSLLTQALGADNIDRNVAAVMTTIGAHVGGNFDTIGRVCLLGRSNGCALALAVAVKLNEKGVEPNFIGLSDVTMFHFGRNPPVTDVGELKPVNPPQVGVGVKLQFFTAFGYPTLSSDTAPPHVRLTKPIRADKKVNLFQTAGNHVKLTSSQGWVWWSTMDDGEVHGTVEGFDNQRKSIAAFTDVARHIKLNLGEHWDKMALDAATALAGF
jgi:hypothetical protein